MNYVIVFQSGFSIKTNTVFIKLQKLGFAHHTPACRVAKTPQKLVLLKHFGKCDATFTTALLPAIVGRKKNTKVRKSRGTVPLMMTIFMCV
jgi:hypothetical protein